MSKLIILQGVPASGKSTWAKSYVKEYPETVIVSRDAIRESTGTYWYPKREDYITDLENAAVDRAMRHHFDIIIDATNLNPKTINKWERIASAHPEYELEFKKFKISYKEALERDEMRAKEGGRAVGKETIKRFFKNYYPEEVARFTDDRKIIEYDNTKPDCIVCDIDGTIALRNGRSPFDLSKVGEDTFDPRMKKFINMFHFIPIIFVSGREGTEQCRKDTTEWLNKNLEKHVNYEIIFRKEGDYRNDAIVKKEIYEEFIKPKYNIVAVFDDRDRVVKMWRDEGILCCQVYYGDF